MKKLILLDNYTKTVDVFDYDPDKFDSVEAFIKHLDETGDKMVQSIHLPNCSYMIVDKLAINIH